MAKLNLAPSKLGPISGLSQATVLAGALVAAWVLWLAVNNKLIVYWQILLGQGGAAATTGSGTVGGSTSGNVTSVTGTPGASVTTSVTPNTFGGLTPFEAATGISPINTAILPGIGI